ncbi:hypothetical protein RI065_04685 [Mycoplasmatota bacterium zrk1]
MNEKVVRILDFIFLNIVSIIIILNAPKLGSFIIMFLIVSWISFIYKKGYWKTEQLDSMSVNRLKFEILQQRLEISLIVLSAVLFYFNILDYRIIISIAPAVIIFLTLLKKN